MSNINNAVVPVGGQVGARPVEAPRRKIYNLLSSQRYYVPSATAEKKPEFPGSWFVGKDPGVKPIAELTVYDKSDLATARVYAVQYLTSGNLGPAAITTYLYHLLPTLKHNLPKTFSSYGVTISPKNDFSPADLITMVSKSVPNPSMNPPNPVSEREDYMLLAAITGIYRLINANEQQQQELTAKLEIILGQLKDAVDIQPGFVTSRAKVLKSHEGLEVVLSAIDLYFHLCPQAPGAVARFGTIILRYNGCSALMDLSHLKKILGTATVFEALEWVFVPSVGQEIDSMLQQEIDEVETEDSYFPYGLGMHLTQKSPYSASVSPGIHLFVHALGTLFGFTRSCNALLLEGPAQHMIASNVALAYLANKEQSALTQIFVTHEPNPEALAARRDGIAQAQAPVNPEDIRPETAEEWISAYHDRQGKFSRLDIEQLTKAVQPLRPRVGTVGEWTKNIMIPLLAVED